jgi:hypothetical protein
VSGRTEDAHSDVWCCRRIGRSWGKPRRRALFAGVLMAALLGSIGLATGAIPGADGTITGCYLISTGALRVVNSASDCCTTAPAPQTEKVVILEPDRANWSPRGRRAT